jgi:hypothetical protein
MGSADPAVHTLERTAITPLVRRVVRSSTVEVSDWSVYPIHSGDGEGLGVYRFVGTGDDRARLLNWSLILKAFGAPAEGGKEGAGTTGSERLWPTALGFSMTFQGV